MSAKRAAAKTPQKVKGDQPKKRKRGGQPGNKNSVGNSGRPPIVEVDDELLRNIEGLGKIKCTEIEAAAFLRVSQPTFNRLLNSNEKAKDAWERGQQLGLISLRRLQFKTAEGGNASMQIWLGKQYLDQKDTHIIGGDKDNPIKADVTFKVQFVKAAHGEGDKSPASGSI